MTTDAAPGFWRRWFGWEDIVFSRTELLVMRLGFALLALWMTPQMWPFGSEPLAAAAEYDSMPMPRGLGQWCDLTFLAQPGVFRIVRWLCWLGLAAYAAGLCVPLALAPVVFANVTLCTLNSSQGYVGHAGQIVGLPLLFQWLASLVALLPRWGGLRNLGVITRAAERLLADWTRQIIAAAYVVTGCTKVIRSGGTWFTRGPQFVMQMEKAQTEAATDLGRPMAEPALRVTEWLAAHPWAASIMLVAALALELGAPLALVNRRLGLLVALALVFFHWTNGVLMSLSFTGNRIMLALYFMSLPFWLSLAWNRLIKKNSAPSHSTP